MKRADVGDVELEYELIGEGEPLLLVHGSNLADGLAPLADALTEASTPLQLVHYHRRGMAGSSGAGSPISVEQQAADALGLLDALGLPAAHVLGYSYGGVVAIEVALAAPARVRSLSLLEPMLTAVPSAAAFMTQMTPVMERYEAGDAAGSITGTFAAFGGEGWRDLVATAGADALEQAIRDAAVFYEAEAPSLGHWSLDESRARAVTAPVLAVLGSDSGAFFEDGRALLHRRFPQCRDADVPDANHLLNLQQPARVAQAVVQFLSLDA